MPDVSFNEPQYQNRERPNAQAGAVTNLAIRMGLAKDAKSAQTALLVVAVIIIAAAVGVYTYAFPEPVPPQPLEMP